jgi:hypothetical protein
MNTVHAIRVSNLTLLGILTKGIVSLCVVFSTGCGVLALFGAETVQINGEPVTGILGLLVSPLVGLFIGYAFSLITWFTVIVGLWFHRRVFDPVIEIAYEPKPSAVN